MPKRQEQIKQVWFTQEDEENFRIVAEALKAKGIDVEPDNRRSKSEYSHTKVLRYLLAEAAKEQTP